MKEVAFQNIAGVAFRFLRAHRIGRALRIALGNAGRRTFCGGIVRCWTGHLGTVVLCSKVPTRVGAGLRCSRSSDLWGVLC